MISRCLALAASFASQRKIVLFAGMDLSSQIERSDWPQAMRSQILFSIARVRIEGRPGRRFVACIAVAIMAVDRLPGKAIKATLRSRARVRLRDVGINCQTPAAASGGASHYTRSQTFAGFQGCPKRCFLYGERLAISPSQPQQCITFTTAAKTTALT